MIQFYISIQNNYDFYKKNNGIEILMNIKTHLNIIRDNYHNINDYVNHNALNLN